MLKDNAVREKSYNFGLSTALFCKNLIEEQKEYILSKQLMRSGTSVGANVEEALQAESRKDFIHKLSIALKEENESYYWLRIIRDCGYSKPIKLQPLLSLIQEVIALLTSIIKSTKAKT